MGHCRSRHERRKERRLRLFPRYGQILLRWHATLPEPIPAVEELATRFLEVLEPEADPEQDLMLQVRDVLVVAVQSAERALPESAEPPPHELRRLKTVTNVLTALLNARARQARRTESGRVTSAAAAKLGMLRELCVLRMTLDAAAGLPWLLGARLATRDEDCSGIDLVLETADVGQLYLQVKSSRRYARGWCIRYRDSPIFARCALVVFNASQPEAVASQLVADLSCLHDHLIDQPHEHEHAHVSVLQEVLARVSPVVPPQLGPFKLPTFAPSVSAAGWLLAYAQRNRLATAKWYGRPKEGGQHVWLCRFQGHEAKGVGDTSRDAKRAAASKVVDLLVGAHARVEEPDWFAPCVPNASPPS